MSTHVADQRPRWGLRPFVPLCMCALVPFVLPGCTASGSTSEEKAREVPPPAPSAPSYKTIAHRYNARLERLPRLWARAAVEVRWREDEGIQEEQGEGHLIVVPPEKAALSVGKLGHTMFWAGTDGTRYWLFDLREDAVVLRHGKGAAQVSGRWVVHPRALPQLLGVEPLAESPAPEAKVDARGDLLFVTLAGRDLRLVLGRDTMRPRRIELLAEAGEDGTRSARVASVLSDYEPLGVPDKPPGAHPRVPTRIEASAVGGDDRITLSLDGLSAAPDKIRPAVFDLDALRERFDPERVTQWEGASAP